MNKPPWTKDVILQTVRFTNVYRELDPGTVFAVQQILETSTSTQDKIFNIMLYRLIGSEETFSKIGLQSLREFNEAELKSKLKFIRDVEGHRPFSNAYIVSSYVQMGSRDKVENVAKLLSKLRDNFGMLFQRLISARSAQEAFQALREQYGFGNFLSYQILVDLLYPIKINGGKSILPFSHDDWAIAGPGAKRGIELLIPEGARSNELDVMRWLRDQQRKEFSRLKLEFPYLRDEKGTQIEITLSNIENCLCEFSKYASALSRGRIRRRFLVPNTPALTKWLRQD